MNKIYRPHEPEEALLTVEQAFQDAEQSEARWQVFEQKQRLHRVLIELPEPAYQTLEALARRQEKTVPQLIEHVLADLLTTFAPLPTLTEG
jgi:hypothetical protein